jgi:DHA2 family multidrug resistance protein
MALVMGVLFASMVLLPVMLQTLMGYSSIDAGMALAPRGMGSFAGMILVGVLSARTDPRHLLAIGLAATAGTLLWFSTLNLQAGYWDFFWPQLIQGLALSLLFVPLTTLTMDGITPAAMGNATSLYNLIRNVGGGLGIAAATTLLARLNTVHYAELAQYVSSLGPAAMGTLSQLTGGFVAQGGDPVAAQRQALAAVSGMVSREAALLSFLQIFRILAGTCLAMLPLVYIVRKPQHQQGGTPHAAVVE